MSTTMFSSQQRVCASCANWMGERKISANKQWVSAVQNVKAKCIVGGRGNDMFACAHSCFKHVKMQRLK